MSGCAISPLDMSICTRRNPVPRCDVSFNPAEQFGNGDAETSRDRKSCLNSEIMLATLDCTHIGAVEPQWSANDSCENPFLCRRSRIRRPRACCSLLTINSLRACGLHVYSVLEDMILIAL